MHTSLNHGIYPSATSLEQSELAENDFRHAKLAKTSARRDRPYDYHGKIQINRWAVVIDALILRYHYTPPITWGGLGWGYFLTIRLPFEPVARAPSVTRYA